jgi:hypothetical protein
MIGVATNEPVQFHNTDCRALEACSPALRTRLSFFIGHEIEPSERDIQSI